MDTIFFLVQQTWFFAIPLLVVALGGLFSERSGVINIALEGIMLIGALCGIGFIHIFNHAMPAATAASVCGAGLPVRQVSSSLCSMPLRQFILEKRIRSSAVRH